MYCYSFTRHFGYDRVALLENSLECQAGDLLLLQGEYFLALGEHVSWGTDYRISSPTAYVAEKGLFDERAMTMIHRLVREYFSGYRQIISLFMTDSLEKLLQRKHSPSASTYCFIGYDMSKSYFTEHKKKKSLGQSLLLFPDLWTLYNHIGQLVDKHKVAVVSSTHSEKQRNDIFWSIKTGHTPSLACTHAGLFQCWSDLRSICIVRSHARYYKNRQDPRYDSVAVCEKLGSIYGSSLIFID